MRNRLPGREKKCTPKICWRNLKDDKSPLFKNRVLLPTLVGLHGDASQMWEAMATKITQVAKQALGVTTGMICGHKESSWWNKDVQDKIKDKQESFKELIRSTDEAKRVGLRNAYRKAKKEAKKVVAEAKNTSYKRMYKRLEIKEGEHHMFKIAKARERKRQDFEAVKFIKGGGMDEC
ncbi:uncharacterized protein LOC143573587 [Bidens hawaiensis]|uniref:uncharacterized protein LOC143573587 n=1 Tax=Bidens hawaiensis TaxID=980011 RepID=UPI004049C7DF